MDTSPTPVTPTVQTTTEDKTVAILSYITLIGFIIAIVMHGSKKTEIGKYHLRQAFGLMLTSIVLIPVATFLAIIPFLGWLIWFLVWAGLIAIWVMGLIAAASGQMKPLPLLGRKFESWFGGMFN